MRICTFELRDISKTSIVLDQEYEINEYHSGCTELNFAGVKNFETLDKCREKCDNDGNCDYFIYTNSGDCMLYKSCDNAAIYQVTGGVAFKKIFPGTTLSKYFINNRPRSFRKLLYIFFLVFISNSN